MFEEMHYISFGCMESTHTFLAPSFTTFATMMDQEGKRNPHKRD